MASTPFVHLHLHSQYSLLDGAIRIGDLIKKAKSYGMPAVALTDHGNMFGALEFYLKCKEEGIKPIVGSEVYVASASRFAKEGSEDASGFHLVLLCQNSVGYRNLSYLVSAGYKEGFYYKPRIDKELLAKHSEGLICLSACLGGEVAVLAGQNRMAEATAVASWYGELFPGRYYLELQENTIPEQRIANDRLMQIAQELDLPLVATNDCHYLEAEDARAHEVLLCIQTGKTITDPKRMHFSAAEFYFKSPEKMAVDFAYAPQALANTRAIADACDLDLGTFKDYYFPHFETPPGKSLDDLLVSEAQQGLEERFPIIRKRQPDFTLEQEGTYRARLQLELDCIMQMGFPGYFLIVADFINWAKNQGIPVGPGRGSAAGSLVAYALRITDLDPLPYNLLFERFLNPERISMPDIDVDFCQDRRLEVLDYVSGKYGRDKVCQIITFGTMSARAVIRDVGRALDLPYGEVDRIAKLVPEILGIKLADAIKQEAKLTESATADGRIRELLDIALRLEGLARHASTHAAGVVVSPDVMEEFCPVYKDKNGSITTQYSMKYVEKIGLVKFDFLGLKNLTVIANAVKIIRDGKDPAFDITTLSDDDVASYELITAGNTTGVFQLESSGMKEMLVKLKPSCFEDVIAACALYRPGPLGSGMVDDFIDRKHGRKKTVYDLPELEPILKDTYGVIVYQEQVMQIARTLAGYSLGGADLLRRAMGKKDPLEMAKQRDIFLSGSDKNGFDHKTSATIFDLMAKFAEYGFNKSHSAAYALIAYQTAYLKAHYPVEFMAALLSEDMGSTDKILKNINDCREMGIEVLPPDINLSNASFCVRENSIRFGLGAVKGVGGGAIEAITAARADGSFKDLADLCERVDLRKVNKRVVEALIKCGSFTTIGARRSQLFATLEESMAIGQKIQQERESAQTSLFGEEEVVRVGNHGRMTIPDIPEWDEKTLLNFEKEVLGFFITGHPLQRYGEAIKRLTTCSLSELGEQRHRAEVRVCGIVSSLKETITKKGDRMGFATVEDLTGMVEIIAFPEVYALALEHLKGEDPLLISGTIDLGEKGAKVLATEIIPMADALHRATRRVLFRFSAPGFDPERLQALRALFLRHPGQCETRLHVTIPNRSETIIRLAQECRVAATDELLTDAKELFGYNVVSFE